MPLDEKKPFLQRNNDNEAKKLSENISQETLLRLRNVTQFKGDIGLENNNVAVKITEKIDEED